MNKKLKTMKTNKYTESGDLNFNDSTSWPAPIIYSKKEYEKKQKKQRGKDFQKKFKL